MKLHLPLLKAVASAFTPYIAMLTSEYFLGIPLVHSLSAFTLWFVGGYFYTNFFEWWYHNYWLHKWRTPLRLEHAYHHAKLHGEYFRTRDQKRLLATTTTWYIFPVLFFVHYLVFIALLGHENSVAFFFGVTFHFTICYEISHWLTHVSNNMVDEKIIPWIPFIRQWRKVQIEHHKNHHREYQINFNFSPPYTGDKLFKTKK